MPLISPPNAKMSTQAKKILPDVVIMRLILIVLLVLDHSFAPFSGMWKSIIPQYDNETYFFIGKLSYSFFLEAFVFISGLLAGYQAVKHPVALQGKEFVTKKFKRLYIPSIIFSLIYFACFSEWHGMALFIRTILSGDGHMWFLPMLFWCFVILWAVSKSKASPRIILLLAIAALCCSNRRIPLRIGDSFYYFLFFYLGYLVYTLPNVTQKFLRMKYTPAYFIIFCLLFAYTLHFEYISTVGGVISYNITRGIRGLSGLMLCYVLVRTTATSHAQLPQPLIKLSSYCFGIYIMQQFILQWLYYHTAFCTIISPTLIPWMGFVVAMILSILLTGLLLKTKTGRYLIG